MDITWLALIAPVVALPALAGAARLEQLATQAPQPQRVAQK